MLMTENDPEFNRVRWQCRRGMLELDLLLMDFLDNQYPELPPILKTDFVRLLNYPDQMLHDWLLGDGLAVVPELQSIVRTIRRRGEVEQK